MALKVFETPPPVGIHLILIGGKPGSGVRTPATALSDRLTRQGIPNERVVDNSFCVATVAHGDP